MRRKIFVITTQLSFFICMQLYNAANAQPLQPDALRTMASSYTIKHFPEKIFIHTDKEVYVAGEILWYKLYYVDGFNHKPLELSKTAYVELVDEKGKPAAQGKISLKQGQRTGSFLLPLTLHSGNYRLRGYTNWMKNEGDNLFFEKLVSVINSLKDPDSTLISDPASYTARFFPEGGNLVMDLNSVVGFSITNQQGKGVKAHGYLLNEKNDTLLNFQTFRSGLGQFTFTPHENENYRALLILEDGGQFISALPPARRGGCVMHVKNDIDQIKISASTNYAEGTILQLAALNRHQVKYTTPSGIRDGKTEWIIDKKLLGEGLSQLTIFSPQGPECERLVFLPPPPPMNLEAGTDKKIYNRREAISLQLPSLKDRDSLDLSVAVYKLDSLEPGNGINLYTYLNLLSELRGNVEDPGFYFSHSDSLEQATENLLLTHGWRRFRWQDIQKSEASSPKYLPEYNGHLLGILLTDSISGIPVTGRKVFLSIPGSPYQFHMAETDRNGIAQFDVPYFFGESRLIFRADSAEGRSFRFKVLDPFYPAEPAVLPTITVRDKISTLEERSLAMQVEHIYSGDSLHVFYTSVSSDSLPFFGRGNYSYALDDYRRFTTMEEVMREYVREVNVIVRNGKLRMRLFDQDYMEPREKDLLVLWDGIRLEDPNQVFGYDPLLIKKLEVIPRGYSLSARPYNGLLSFTSYDNSIPGISPDQVSGVEYEGMQLEREFYSPEYATDKQRQSHLPDFRHTLYWNPNLILNHADRQLRFYAGDLKGKFRVDIQGIDASGRVMLQELFFEIN